MIRLRTLLVIWSVISIVLGIAATQISWGDPEGFHGTGFPFASVYWDFIGDADPPVDYSNPYAPILNSATFLIVGSILISAIYWIVATVRGTASKRREEAA